MFSKHFSSGWILLVPNLGLLKYFDITLPRHKSSKIEDSSPALMSHSIQFHCVCFHFSTVSKRENVYTRWHMKGVHVPSHLQSCTFLSFLLYFWRPNSITALSKWWTPDWPLRTQEIVPNRRTRGLPLFRADPRRVPGPNPVATTIHLVCWHVFSG